MIRSATPDELPAFGATWARALMAETRQVDDLGPFVQLGPRKGHGTHRNFLRHALAAGCLAWLDDPASIVSVLEEDGVVLGWCAWQPATVERPLTIAFLFVADLVRRRGFGSILLRDVLGFRDDRAPRLTCITASGAAFYRAAAALLDTGEQHAGTQHAVVEAQG